MVVTVIPTWAPDNWVERCLSAWATPRSLRAWLGLASAMRRSRAAGSTATSENSAATKMKVPTVSTTPRPTRIQSRITNGPQLGCYDQTLWPTLYPFSRYSPTLGLPVVLRFVPQYPHGRKTGRPRSLDH